MRSPLAMPRAASAAASAETRPSISRQVQDRSPQTKPTRSPCRRAFCVRRCARFITRRDIGVTPPDGAALVRVRSPHARPAAALAFYDLVALLEQALALAILALLLLLDVGAFFVGHEELQALMRDAIRCHSTNDRCR